MTETDTDIGSKVGGEMGSEMGGRVARATRGGTGGEADGAALAGRHGDVTTAERPESVVVPLNDAAAVYETLADQIRGSAVGWSDAALANLEDGLLQRYGPILGGRQAVRRLIRLASHREAA